jgi:hypothetical protein
MKVDKRIVHFPVSDVDLLIGSCSLIRIDGENVEEARMKVEQGFQFVVEEFAGKRD